MTIAHAQPVYYETVWEVYQAMKVCRRLSGISHCFGKKEGQALASIPRIEWRPAPDRFRPAEMGGEQAIRPGPDGRNQEVEINEFDRRDAGAEVWLFANDYDALERLVIRFRGALADVMRADSAYSAPNGYPLEPEADSTQSWAYRMPLSLRLICADVTPVISPTNDSGELGSTL